MKKTDTITVLATITDDDIKSAVGVLIDNGVDADGAVDVLQAIGYVLIDTELFPEPI